MAGFRLCAALPLRLPPVRECRFLLFCPRGRAAGGLASRAVLSGAGGRVGVGGLGVSFAATVAGRVCRLLLVSVRGGVCCRHIVAVCLFFFPFCVEEKNQVSCRGFDPRGEFFFFWRRRKIKVSCRGFDPRWPHSACETVIAAHMVKQQCLR